MLGAPPPARLLDLASGDGALVDAALSAWDVPDHATVDVDPRSRRGDRHLVADALDPDLPDRLGAFDVVLCNPPYLRAPPRPDLLEALAQAGLAGAIGSAPFVAQALRLAAPGGRVGLVLPDGLATGRRAEPFRRALLAACAVESVAQLPRGAFARTEARAFLVALRRVAPVGATALFEAGRDGTPGEPVAVDADALAERFDYAFHASRRRGGATLSDLGAEVRRGSLDRTKARPAGRAPFHTVDFPRGAAREALALPEGDEAYGVVAEPGDILLARVDRGLERKVCMVASGRAVLTSSVLRVRLHPRWRSPVLAALLSDDGARSLAATARGVGARMLGKADLMGMPLPGVAGLPFPD